MKIPRLTIAKIVARSFGLTFEQLMESPRRPIVHARYAAFHLINKYRRDTSSKEIGRLFNRDHTSVLNGFERVKILLVENADYRSRVEEAEKIIAQWRPAEPRFVKISLGGSLPAEREENPPAALKIDSSVDDQSPRRGTVEYTDQNFRMECEKNDEKFRAAMMQAYPDRACVQEKAAAE